METIRTQELGHLRKFLLLMSCNQVVLQSGPILVALCTFGLYTVVEKEPLQADTVFTALSLFYILQLPLMMMPRILTLLVQARVASQRLQEYLLAENIQSSLNTIPRTSPVQKKQQLVNETQTPSSADLAIDIQNVDYFIESGEASIGLRNLSLSISIGQLVMVTGSVGSGKSTLCSAILGELQQRDGSHHVQGSVAYVAQVSCNIITRRDE